MKAAAFLGVFAAADGWRGGGGRDAPAFGRGAADGGAGLRVGAMDGTLRDGRYAIAGTLGSGGQGTTYDAVDKKQGRPVAIKRFSVRGAASWKDVELAEREATVLESLSHPSLP